MTITPPAPVESFVRPRTGLSLPGGEWFVGAGLGLFVHWDHASQQGFEISWPLVGDPVAPGLGDGEGIVTVEQYQSSAATFNPENWDPTGLACLAKDVGARYVVFTARHAAGYSMFHTAYSDFSIEHSAYGRDITRELIDAVRAEGLRVGIYYSLPDWHHPDYPAFEMADRPYPREFWPDAKDPANAGTPVAEDRHRRATPEQWACYQQYLRGQIAELLTSYGPIDLLWFDGDWERSEDEWDSAALRELIKSLQPAVLINDRLPGQGDYRTPEQGFPVITPEGPWELCLTIGKTWGWVPTDTSNKSAASIVTTLIEVVSRGGNLLLNVGPRGDGSISESHLDALTQVGSWIEAHAESVVDVSPTTGVDFYGPTTARPGTLYVHLVMRPLEDVVVRGIPVHRISAVRLLATGEELGYETHLEAHQKPAAGANVLGELRLPVPMSSGALVDVIAIEFS